MKYGSTVLFVENVKESIAFYEAAFGFPTKFFDEAFGFAILNAGGSELGLSSFKGGEQMMPGKFQKPSEGKTEGVEIAFYLDDVPAAFEKAIAAGATEMASPKKMPWGQSVAYVKCPEGTIVGLCTPIAE